MVVCRDHQNFRLRVAMNNASEGVFEKFLEDHSRASRQELCFYKAWVGVCLLMQVAWNRGY